MSARETSPAFSLPAEVLEALRPHLEALGVTPPDTASLVPCVNLDTPIRELGIQLGGLLKNKGLFRFGAAETLCVIEDGKRVVMTPVKFCSWVERHVKVVKTRAGTGGSNYDVTVSMGKDVAAKLLEVYELQREMPVLNAVLPVRLPVRRASGLVELCAAGWDREEQVYCTDSIEYPKDWTLGQACEYLETLCKDFPFAEREGRLWDCRSFLVHVAALLGVYVRRLLPPGTIRPLIFYMANEQGSGKSLLVQMVLAGCFGVVHTADLPKGNKGVNQEKFTALLETVAQSMKEVLFLDDVPSNVWSHSLNRFITSPGHEGRIYGDNTKLFEVPNVTQVFMTGNLTGMTRDIMQRALVCELFLETESTSRQFGNELTALWLGAPEQRRDLLAACWAFVKNWMERGAELGQWRQSRAAAWSRLVGGIMAAADIEKNPFELPELPAGGDRETEEWKLLFRALGDLAEDWVKDNLGDRSFSLNTKRIVEVARENHLLLGLVGAEDDKALSGSELRCLGMHLARWLGRSDLKTSSGRGFRFGKRKGANNWNYPIEWLEPWPEPEV